MVQESRSLKRGASAHAPCGASNGCRPARPRDYTLRRQFHRDHALPVGLPEQEAVPGRPLKEDRKNVGLKRLVPLHPELDRLLEAWRRGGLVELFGRPPTASDYLVPNAWDVRDHQKQEITRKWIKRDARVVGAAVLSTPAPAQRSPRWPARTRRSSSTSSER